MRAIHAIGSVIFAAACGNSAPSTGPGGGTKPDAGETPNPDAGESDAPSAPDAAIPKLADDAIVFAAALDGQSAPDLYVTNGATTTRLTTTVGGELYPAISPDRTQIAFTRDFQLFVTDASGANERLVAPVTGRQRKINDMVYSTTVGPAAWSPDGKQLAYLYPREPFIIMNPGETIDESYATTIHLVDRDGANDRVLSPSLDRTINSLSWSSTNTLAFTQADDCPDCAGGQWYALIAPDGTGFQEVHFRAVSNTYPSPTKHLDWSPDSTRWAFVVNGYGDYDQPALLFTSSANVDNEQPLTDVAGWNPRWAPNGTTITFIAADGIYEIAASGGTPRRVLAVMNVRGLDR